MVVLSLIVLQVELEVEAPSSIPHSLNSANSSLTNSTAMPRTIFPTRHIHTLKTHNGKLFLDAIPARNSLQTPSANTSQVLSTR